MYIKLNTKHLFYLHLHIFLYSKSKIRLIDNEHSTKQYE